jgi:hypothetical protein
MEEERRWPAVSDIQAELDDALANSKWWYEQALRAIRDAAVYRDRVDRVQLLHARLAYLVGAYPELIPTPELLAALDPASTGPRTGAPWPVPDPDTWVFTAGAGR